MSLRPQAPGPVPEETARIAHAAFPKGTSYLRLRDRVGAIYTDDAFAALFPSDGQPAEAPWRLALVTVLQFAEGLTDRQAADAVRGRLDWKYVLGLELTDPGFDFSVLCEFRVRLVTGSAELQLLETMLTWFKLLGLLKPRGRQRTDSTHVLAAIRALNRLETVGETLRHGLNSLAVVAPEWLRAHVPPEWFERYGSRLDETRLPKGQAERQALAERIGADGCTVLGAVWAPDAPAWLRAVPAVETLRQVWVQQYAVSETGVRWRTAQDLPPAAKMINSPYDPDARYSVKRTTHWVGYKAHLTETCEHDAPHLITDVQTTLATVPDVAMGEPVQAALAARDALPKQHLLDSGYVDATLLVTSQRHKVEVVGPVRGDSSWQARAAQGFAARDFTVDWEAQRVVCPQGRTSVKWLPVRDPRGTEEIKIEFAREDCRACPSRACCTRSGTDPRQVTLLPRAQHVALHAARQRQVTPEFAAQYAARAGVEGTISQSTRSFELRRTRYVGLAKTRLQHVITAAALNVVRVVAWLDHAPVATTRTSPFAALAPLC